MNLNSKSKMLALTLGLLGVVWCLGAFAIRDISDTEVSVWGGVVGGLLAIFIVEIYLLVFRTTPGRQAIEIGAVSIYYTIIYFFVAAGMNTVFILMKHGDFNWGLVIANALLGVLYVTLILYVEKDTERIQRQLNHTEQKLFRATDLSRKLGELLSIAEDDAVRKQLIKLKEMMDYSSNISTGSTYATEETLEAQLNEVMQLMISKADSMIILNKLSAAETTWKIRSSNASSVR